MKIQEIKINQNQIKTIVVTDFSGSEYTYKPSFPTEIVQWMGGEKIVDDRTGALSSISNGVNMGIIISGPPSIVEKCLELIDPVITNGINT